MPETQFHQLDEHEELFWGFLADHEEVDRWFSAARADIAKIDPSLVTPAQVEAISTAMLVESDLPVYMMELLRSLRPYQYLASFIPIWGEEEVKHFLILKLALQRLGVDPRQLDRMIAETRASTWNPPPTYSPAMVTAYTTVQEQLTTLFYDGVAARCQDPVLARIMRRIAKDERRHFAYYRKVTKALIADDPSGQTRRDVRQALIEFDMPGAGIVPDYERRCKVSIQESGITVQAAKQVLMIVHDFMGGNPLATLDVMRNSLFGAGMKATGWDAVRLARQVVLPTFRVRPTAQ